MSSNLEINLVDVTMETLCILLLASKCHKGVNQSMKNPTPATEDIEVEGQELGTITAPGCRQGP